MAAITATALSGAGLITPSINTLTASDTFTYLSGAIMIIRNPTGGAISTLLIKGDASTSFTPDGLPPAITTSGGFVVGSIAAGAQRVIRLDSIKNWILGNCTLITGTSLEVILLNP